MSATTIATGRTYLLKCRPTLHGRTDVVYVCGGVAVEALTIDLHDETVLVKVLDGWHAGQEAWVDIASLDDPEVAG